MLTFGPVTGQIYSTLSSPSASFSSATNFDFLCCPSGSFDNFLAGVGPYIYTLGEAQSWGAGNFSVFNLGGTSADFSRGACVWVCWLAVRSVARLCCRCRSLVAILALVLWSSTPTPSPSSSRSPSLLCVSALPHYTTTTLLRCCPDHLPVRSSTSSTLTLTTLTTVIVCCLRWGLLLSSR